MEYAGDPTFDSIFTSRKVTNIFESLSKDENILETDLFNIVAGDIIVPYYVETFIMDDCAVCYFKNFLQKTLFAPYIRVYSKNKIHFGCRAEFPPPAFYNKTFSNVPQRFIKMNRDDIHYVFDIKDITPFVIYDVEGFYFHVKEQPSQVANRFQIPFNKKARARVWYFGIDNAPFLDLQYILL